MGAYLERETPGHFRHGCEQRVAPGAIGDGFIGNGLHPAGHEFPCELRSGGEMQIAEKGQPAFQEGVFARLGLFDFHHQVDVISRRGIGHGRRARRSKGFVSKPDTRARSGLDPNLVPGGHQRPYARGRDAHAIFMILDFFEHTDQHQFFLAQVVSPDPRRWKCLQRLNCALFLQRWRWVTVNRTAGASAPPWCTSVGFSDTRRAGMINHGPLLGLCNTFD